MVELTTSGFILTHVLLVFWVNIKLPESDFLPGQSCTDFETKRFVPQPKAKLPFRQGVELVPVTA